MKKNKCQHYLILKIEQSLNHQRYLDNQLTFRSRSPINLFLKLSPSPTFSFSVKESRYLMRNLTILSKLEQASFKISELVTVLSIL